MSPFRKNFIVGLTVLTGLLLLASMIVMFDKAPARLFATDREVVIFEATRADGLSQGSGVLYLGVNVGTVEDVRRDPKDSTRVLIRALVEKSPPLPANIVGKIRSQFVGGGSRLDLQVIDHTPTGEAIEHPLPTGQLVPDPNKPIAADYLGIDVLPPEIAEMAVEMRRTTAALRESKIIDNANAMVKDISAQANRFGTLVDTLNTTISDPQMQKDLRSSLANIRTTTDNATRISANLEKFSNNLDHLGNKMDALSDNASATLTKTQADLDHITKKVDDRLEQVAKLLDTFESISAKIDKGQGTAGMLVNDNKLYLGLADTTQELKAAITDLKLLIQQWTQEGATVRLGGK